MATVASRRDPWLGPEPPDLPVPAGMRRERFAAMGTTVSLLLPASRAGEGAEAVRALFAFWEQTLSRFRADSELSYLNKHAGRPVVAGAVLFDVVAAAVDAAYATDGLYDPTLLGQLIHLGYDRSFEVLPDVASAATATYRVTPGGCWRSIKMDRARRRITLPVGCGLDLGGIAKGMAVDAALEQLRAMGIEAALVNAGGDLAVHGLPAGDTAWSIMVPGSDVYPEGRHLTVPLRHGAMATSGIAHRRWQQGQETRHHLLDPRSGAPAQSGLWSATAVAALCTQAEVAAKVAFILGPVDGVRFLQTHGLAGLLVSENGEWHAAGSWPSSLPASLPALKPLPPASLPVRGRGETRKEGER